LQIQQLLRVRASVKSYSLSFLNSGVLLTLSK
jgi:hypothetical protein